MCGTCGCGQADEGIRITMPGEHTHTHDHSHSHESGEHAHPHGHEHSHNHEHHGDHDHSHAHEHGADSHDHSHTLNVEIDILHKNERLAERNRGYFEALGILALNLVSSPGSGKTTLLEETIRQLKGKYPVSVIEGDQQTMNDADRIGAAGAPVVQINTGNGCHLDADMIRKAVERLKPEKDSVLFIENVGNLVCPALFDLGEASRVVIISVTEGDDKPLKYPNMFQGSQLCIINKTDLLPYVPFDMDKVKAAARSVNPGIGFIECSVLKGSGMEDWLTWIDRQRST